MLEVFLDSLKDSAIVLAIVFAVYVLLAFFEPKFAHKMEHAGRWAPLIGAGIGLIPQCGFSVVGADLYHKQHITLGTLIAIFVATSDEALPIFLGATDTPRKMLALLKALSAARIRPYYVFQCDPVEGVRERFGVPLEKAREIERYCAERIGGLALPRFVADVPGAKRKIPIEVL